ncbi:baseplate J/gp47 family protein [Mesobacillus zeae]|uniref:Baseplate J/gp47 family protein n=1 Tax=Mesobacillus zeae TaxID=1917180 RepID=A0A398BBK4_9BACI|nr:baseplate J/gp47 family protein [Mesobacillus zeae]RID85013.1 baseplate J/gp47 family protein [Mesobacillus zeae]
MLDKSGFKRKTYADLIEEMSDKARELFGDNINVSPRSPFGLILRLFAWFLALAWELAEKVYNSAFVGKAEGVQLDNLTPFFNTNRKPEQEAIVTLSFTGTPNYVIQVGTRFETINEVDFMLTEDVQLDVSGKGLGLAVCMTPGALGNVAAGTITVISEPNADVLTVNNSGPAAGGQDRETDAELTERLLVSGAGAGSASPNAILAAVLAVPGVRAANIAVNNKMVAENGLPPKSFQIYAHGGTGPAVAEAIFSKMTAGIESFGTTDFTMEDIAGNKHIVKYTPASVIDIFANITLVTDSTFEIDGLTQVRNGVINVINNLEQGDDVILQRLVAAVMGAQGVTDVTIKTGKTADLLSAVNIPIEPQEVAQALPENISVVAS